MENIAEEYLNRLYEETNPGALLANFYKQLFGVELNSEYYTLFNKLVKLYGRERVYFAILDCTSMKTFTAEDPIAILSYFCKKGLIESSTRKDHIIDVGKIEKDINSLKNKKRRKTKFEDPFEEGS